MQFLRWIHSFISLLHFLSLFSFVLTSLTCDRGTQYQVDNVPECCEKCPPGQKMLSRCTKHSPTKCSNCLEGYYQDNYNEHMNCKDCNGCSMSELEYESKCSPTRNAVCKCKEGYRCLGIRCLDCEKNPPPKTHPKPTTQKNPPPNTDLNYSVIHPRATPPITRPTTGLATLQPNTDVMDTDVNKWTSLCAVAVCACILITCLVATSKLQPALLRIMSTNGFWAAKKTTASNPSGEEVPMPIQEMCGKSEALLIEYVV